MNVGRNKVNRHDELTLFASLFDAVGKTRAQKQVQTHGRRQGRIHGLRQAIANGIQPLAHGQECTTTSRNCTAENGPKYGKGKVRRGNGLGCGRAQLVHDGSALTFVQDNGGNLENGRQTKDFTCHGKVVVNEKRNQDADWVRILAERDWNGIDQEWDNNATSGALKAHGDKLVRVGRILWQRWEQLGAWNDARGEHMTVSDGRSSSTQRRTTSTHTMHKSVGKHGHVANLGSAQEQELGQLRVKHPSSRVHFGGHFRSVDPKEVGLTVSYCPSNVKLMKLSKI